MQHNNKIFSFFVCQIDCDIEEDAVASEGDLQVTIPPVCSASFNPWVRIAGSPSLSFIRLMPWEMNISAQMKRNGIENFNYAHAIANNSDGRFPFFFLLQGITQSLILAICVNFLFVRIHFILKLIVGLIIVVFYSWIIFASFGILFEVTLLPEI